MGRWCWPRNIYIWPIGNLLDDHIKREEEEIRSQLLAPYIFRLEGIRKGGN
jgi:hypothetical protein